MNTLKNFEKWVVKSVEAPVSAGEIESLAKLLALTKPFFNYRLSGVDIKGILYIKRHCADPQEPDLQLASKMLEYLVTKAEQCPVQFAPEGSAVVVPKQLAHVVSEIAIFNVKMGITLHIHNTDTRYCYI